MEQGSFAPGGSLYHSWEWGELRSAEGWLPWRVLAEIRDEVVCALQILEKPLPLGGGLLYAPRGIAGADGNLHSIQQLALWLKDFVRQPRGIVLRMDPEFLDVEEGEKRSLTVAGFVNLPNQWSFWNLSRSGMILDLTPPLEGILLGMRSTHRQRIRHADRDKMEIESGTGDEQVRELYNMVRASSVRQGFWTRGVAYFHDVRDRFLLDGNGMIFVARRGGRPSAANMILRFGSTAYYFHGGFDPTVRNPGATEALHWQAIQ